jgi:hypothetical protein
MIRCVLARWVYAIRLFFAARPVKNKSFRFNRQAKISTLFENIRGKSLYKASKSCYFYLPCTKLPGLLYF